MLLKQPLRLLLKHLRFLFRTGTHNTQTNAVVAVVRAYAADTDSNLTEAEAVIPRTTACNTVIARRSTV